jgi:hypothetical protein
VKKAKRIHTGFAVAPQTAKVTVKCFKMEKTFSYKAWYHPFSGTHWGP